MVEHVRELALPKILKFENIPLPNIPVVLKHCARLDNLFHTKKFPVRLTVYSRFYVFF